jgi:hypothetical protein
MGVAAALLLLSGCFAGSHGSGTSSAPPKPTLAVASGYLPIGRIETRGAAVAAAEGLFALVKLAPGQLAHDASPSQGLPGPVDVGEFDSPVIRSRWWTVPGTETAVAFYARAHPPPGWRSEPYQIGNADSFVVTWTPDSATPVHPGPTLMMFAVQGVGHTDVQVDARVDWQPQMSPLETVPASVTTMTLDYTGPSHPGGAAAQHERRVVTGPVVQRLAAQLNAMGRPTSGADACATDFGQQVVIAVAYAAHAVAFTVAMQGCGGVKVTADGQAELPLQRTNGMKAAIYSALGLAPPPYEGPAAGRRKVGQ